MLALAARMNIMEKFDVKIAFLNENLTEDIYIYGNSRGNFHIYVLCHIARILRKYVN